jgi:hypothetical protein
MTQLAMSHVAPSRCTTGLHKFHDESKPWQTISSAHVIDVMNLA